MTTARQTGQQAKGALVALEQGAVGEVESRMIVITAAMIAAGTTVLLEADYLIESESDVVRDILYAALSAYVDRSG